MRAGARGEGPGADGGGEAGRKKGLYVSRDSSLTEADTSRLMGSTGTRGSTDTRCSDTTTQLPSWLESSQAGWGNMRFFLILAFPTRRRGSRCAPKTEHECHCRVRPCECHISLDLLPRLFTFIVNGHDGAFSLEDVESQADAMENWKGSAWKGSEKVRRRVYENPGVVQERGHSPLRTLSRISDVISLAMRSTASG